MRQITPLLYEVEEVMEMTRLGRTKLYEKFRTGELESVVVDTKRLVPHDALVRFIEGLPRGINR